jgi:hypothetical protein
MADARLRGWWWHKQGLDGVLAGKSAAEVLAAAGWARSVAFEKFNPSKLPQYALVSSLDGIGQLRRDLRSLLAEEDQDRVFARTGTLATVLDMPSHAIMERGRVVGWWEYDAGTGSIAWMAFTKPDAAMQEAVNRTEAFIREDLGDARSFSLDSPKARAPKIEALRMGTAK